MATFYEGWLSCDHSAPEQDLFAKVTGFSDKISKLGKNICRSVGKDVTELRCEVRRERSLVNILLKPSSLLELEFSLSLEKWFVY
jgi:hypothetical protein